MTPRIADIKLTLFNSITESRKVNPKNGFFLIFFIFEKNEYDLF